MPRKLAGRVMTRRKARDHLAEEADAADHVAAGPRDGPADIGQELDEGRAPHGMDGLEAAIGHLVEQDVVLGAGADEIGRQALRPELMAGAVENPGAQGIEPVDVGQIDEDAPPLLGGRRHLGDALFHRRGPVHGPAPGEHGAHLVAGPLDRGLGLMGRSSVWQGSRPSRIVPVIA